MQDSLTELVRIASAELSAASVDNSGAGLGQALGATLQRLLENSSLSAGLVRDAMQERLQPTPRESATPLRELVAAESLRRVPTASLVDHLNAHGWAVLDGALPTALVHGAALEA